jgi:dihydrofolate reductase
MKKVILYTACSIDGYIARPDDSLDWLDDISNPDKTDHGYSDLLNRISCIIMGRRTYSAVIGSGIDWPYAGTKTYVVTTDKSYEIKTPDAEIITGNISEAIMKIKSASVKDIWLAGGGQLVTYFLNNDLIDIIIISVIPRILGDGIALFPGKPKETKWKLIDNISYSTGVVNLTYVRMDLI